MTRISDFQCPHCRILLLEDSIYTESSTPNPYATKGCGEFKFDYVWRWCPICLYSSKDELHF